MAQTTRQASFGPVFFVPAHPYPLLRLRNVNKT